MDFKVKYVELAQKWLANNPANEPADFNKVCRLRLKKELPGVDWTPADWLAAAEVVTNGPPSQQVTETAPQQIELPAPPAPPPVAPAPTPAVDETPIATEPEPTPPMAEKKASLINVAEDTEALPEVLLVGGRISRSGPVTYEKEGEDTKVERTVVTTEERVRTTRRTIRDLEGYEAAVKLIGQLNSGLSKICITSLFGRLCRLDKEQELRDYIREARILAKKHNDSALGRLHKVQVRLVPGFIAGDAERVAKGLVTEMQDLFTEMQGALDRNDVKAIRDVADRMREAAPVFKGKEQEKINAAIKSARKMARKLVSEVQKKGRLIEEVKMEVSTEAVSRARMDFLAMPSDFDADLEEPAVEAGKVYDGIDTATGELVNLEEPAADVGDRFDTVVGG